MTPAQFQTILAARVRHLQGQIETVARENAIMVRASNSRRDQAAGIAPTELHLREREWGLRYGQAINELRIRLRRLNSHIQMYGQSLTGTATPSQGASIATLMDAGNVAKQQARSLIVAWPGMPEARYDPLSTPLDERLVQRAFPSEAWRWIRASGATPVNSWQFVRRRFEGMGGAIDHAAQGAVLAGAATADLVTVAGTTAGGGLRTGAAAAGTAEAALRRLNRTMGWDIIPDRNDGGGGKGSGGGGGGGGLRWQDYLGILGLTVVAGGAGYVYYRTRPSVIAAKAVIGKVRPKRPKRPKLPKGKKNPCRVPSR